MKKDKTNVLRRISNRMKDGAKERAKKGVVKKEKSSLICVKEKGSGATPYDMI